MKILQTPEIEKIFVKLPEEFQQKLSKQSDVKSLCEQIILLLNNHEIINSQNGKSIIQLLLCVAKNSELPIAEKAKYSFKSALFVQNLLQHQKAEEIFIEARGLFEVVEDTLSIQNVNINLAINSLYLAKYAEAQQYLLLVEETINFSPKEEDLEAIQVLCKFFKAVNYIHLGTASRKSYEAYTEKIYNFFVQYTVNKSWSNGLLSEYFLLLQCSVEASMLMQKYWLAYKIFLELPKVLQHPNTFPQTKEFAKNELQILEFELMMRVGNVQKKNFEEITHLFESIELTYFEFYNQKLNISILLCEYYFLKNDYDSAKKWYLLFEKQKIESQRCFIPEETGYIEFYNDAVQFFTKHGDHTFAQKYIEINTKLHKEAIVKADSFRYEVMKLSTKLQKEISDKMKLEFQIEKMRQQLLSQITYSKNMENLVGNFSTTIHSNISDFTEKKQQLLLKQVRKYKELQRDTQKYNVFEQEFSQVFPNFIRSFQLQYPKVTKTEIQICMAVLLNLSNQQIADLFHKEVKSVEENIRKIRRKLKLEHRANLKTYLMLWTK